MLSRSFIYIWWKDCVCIFLSLCVYTALVGNLQRKYIDNWANVRLIFSVTHMTNTMLFQTTSLRPDLFNQGYVVHATFTVWVNLLHCQGKVQLQHQTCNISNWLVDFFWQCMNLTEKSQWPVWMSLVHNANAAGPAQGKSYDGPPLCCLGLSGLHLIH